MRKLLFYKTFLIIIVTFSIIFLLINAAFAGNVKKYSFLSGSTALTSSYYALYVAAEDIAMNNIQGVTFTILETGGASDNLKRLINEQIDCGGVNLNNVYESTNGLGPWKDKKQSNDTRTVFMLTKAYFPFWATDESGINSIKDLEGKKFYTGMPGTTTQTSFKLTVEDTLEIIPDYFTGSLSDAISAIKDRRCDGLIKATSGKNPGSAITQILASSINLKPFGFSDEESEKIRESVPWIGLTKMPKGFFEGFSNVPEMTILSSSLGMSVRKEFPEEIAYEWAKAADKDWGKIVEVFPGAGLIDVVEDTISLVAEVPGCYLHPGAIRYYEEKGIKIPESIIPPEMK